MVRGLLNKLASKSLSVAGKWQQQQLRRLNIHEYQGAELMGKHGVNVPRGAAASSIEEVKKVVKDMFPNESELVVKSQILAGGRGLGTFKNGFQGGVHIVKADKVEETAGKMLGQTLVTKQTGPQGKVVNKILDLDKGLGPHWSVFEILPNFGIGKAVQGPSPTPHIIATPNKAVNNNDEVNHFTEGLVNKLLPPSPSFPWSDTDPMSEFLSNDITSVMNAFSSPGLFIKEPSANQSFSVNPTLVDKDKGKNLLPCQA